MSGDDGQNGKDTREPRESRMFLATMHSSRFPPTRVTIRNISHHGLSARADITLQVGETVTFNLGTEGEAEGIIRWVAGNRFGAELTREISSESFDFSQKAWTFANAPLPTDHVFTQFKPEGGAGGRGSRSADADAAGAALQAASA